MLGEVLLYVRIAKVPGKPGKVGEFDIRRGKVQEIVVCWWCATGVEIVTK